MEVNLKQMPALDWCLSEAWPYWRGGPDQSCENCPFKDGPPRDQAGQEIPYSEIANDPSESYYKCSLLDKVVWGEYAPCKPEHWKARARQELGLSDKPTAEQL